MTWEYRECEVILEVKPERQLMDWLTQGWELVGLHRKHRRSRIVVVAILRRETAPKSSVGGRPVELAR
jgi:hypothetical protein